MQHLIAEHIPRLRRYARALLQNVATADDLVQDTLERAWSRRSLFRAGSDLRAWLFTIMHNIFINQYHRTASAPATVALEDEAFQIAAIANAEGNVVIRDLAAALQQLNPDLREVVLLVGVEQMSYEEVAQILQIPLGTVMSRLSRGRERLRSLMSGGAPAATTLRRIK